MEPARYNEIKREVLDLAKSVEERKRPSYAGVGKCALENFKRDGSLLDIHPLKALGVHLLKQVGAILSFINNPDIPPSEPLISRAADLVNYSCLLVALADDEGRDTGLATTKDNGGTMATKRSKLLESYLRMDLGWDTGTGDGRKVCVKCRKVSDGYKNKHCWNCGAKLPTVSANTSKILSELEAALRYSVDCQD